MGRPSDKASIKLRTQEIINNSVEQITVQEAMERALAERFKDDMPGLVAYAAGLSKSTMRDMRTGTYNLADPGDSALINIPQLIAISTPDRGDLFVQRDQAALGQVRQHHRERGQHQAVQRLRHERFEAESLDPLKDEPDELMWWQARALLLGAATEEIE